MGGTLTLDGGTRPPYNLSSGCSHKKVDYPHKNVDVKGV